MIPETRGEGGSFSGGKNKGNPFQSVLRATGGVAHPVTRTENSPEPARRKGQARGHTWAAGPPYLAHTCGLDGTERMFQLGARV